MTTAGDVMSGSAECASENDTLVDAARKMKDLDVGSLPICGEDDRLRGVVADRDIMVNCIADGRDPSSVKVSGMGDGKPVTIGADDSVDEILRTMTELAARRLPVIDGDRLVGVVGPADVARNLPEDKVGDLVAAISAGPANG